jgi:hypothetical protein
MFLTFPSPCPRALTHLFALKMLRAKEPAPITYSSDIFTSNSHLSLSRNLGAHKERGFIALGIMMCSIFN